MAGKRIEYDNLIEFYHRLNKRRSLLPHESERLQSLVKQKAWAEAQRRFREKNAKKLDTKKREWYHQNKDRAGETCRLYREAKPEVIRRACKRWREKKKQEATFDK